jgi:hypothetical protein
VRKHYGIEIDPAKLQFGGIIGRAEIVDCVKRSDSPWFMGMFGFVLCHACKLPFIPNKGTLGLCAAPANLPPIYLEDCVNTKALRQLVRPGRPSKNNGTNRERREYPTNATRRLIITRCVAGGCAGHDRESEVTGSSRSSNLLSPWLCLRLQRSETHRMCRARVWHGEKRHSAGRMVASARPSPKSRPWRRD